MRFAKDNLVNVQQVYPKGGKSIRNLYDAGIRINGAEALNHALGLYDPFPMHGWSKVNSDLPIARSERYLSADKVLNYIPFGLDSKPDRPCEGDRF